MWCVVWVRGVCRGSGGWWGGGGGGCFCRVEQPVIYQADLHEYALVIGCVGVCKGGVVCQNPPHTHCMSTDRHTITLAGGEIVNERETEIDNGIFNGP